MNITITVTLSDEFKAMPKAWQWHAIKTGAVVEHMKVESGYDTKRIRSEKGHIYPFDIADTSNANL